MYERILVPLDGSKAAEAALSHAVRMAEIFGSEIVLMGVAGAQDHPGSDAVDLQKRAVEDSHTYLEGLLQTLQSRGLRVSKVVRCGNAAEHILEQATAQGMSLIVMATHGRHGVGRRPLGSTAESVLRGATVPILLIRAAPSPATSSA